MKFKLIVATCHNNGIGYRNNLPWSLKNDLHRFSKLTKGNYNNAVIMGKNTWISIPNKPLKHRTNLIISSTLDNTHYNNNNNNNIIIFKTIELCIDYCKDNKFDDIWVIGGEKIYKYFLENNLINFLYITNINKKFICDTYFPIIDSNKWKLLTSEYVEDNIIENNHNNNMECVDVNYNIYILKNNIRHHNKDYL